MKLENPVNVSPIELSLAAIPDKHHLNDFRNRNEKGVTIL